METYFGVIYHFTTSNLGRLGPIVPINCLFDMS